MGRLAIQQAAMAVVRDGKALQKTWPIDIIIHCVVLCTQENFVCTTTALLWGELRPKNGSGCKSKHCVAVAAVLVRNTKYIDGNMLFTRSRIRMYFIIEELGSSGTTDARPRRQCNFGDNMLLESWAIM